MEVFSNFCLDSLEQQIHSRPGIVRLTLSTCDQCNSLLIVKPKSWELRYSLFAVVAIFEFNKAGSTIII